MPQVSAHASETACHLRRLVDFAEPRPDDTCLDVGCDTSGLLGPWVREMTSADAASVPEGPFTLITARLTPTPDADPVALIRRLLGVCAGRLVVADVVRTRAGDSGRVERVRDPDRTTTRTFDELVELVREAGGQTRRLDVFTIERPVEPWLAASDGGDDLRAELTAELDGGPKTGARPRLIGRELWFTQSWAYVAAEPA
ncbi:class I SAM-dependent methyltransferase [Actinoallomurus rhizosphaericola]|uniref:class I SAM-dependent methyltransferase n=1 Tax=Actinoallomurus rhizosphaericola TaxID=2952536 RepID=UPI00209169D1|nr:class I SAM-dependent methyltransferase [Actinoallomurus rhizosphaericola]MCO5993096.1 class I SAM-dependent methyltransferase [Actinoallomurus rhizosphaericola]